MAALVFCAAALPASRLQAQLFLPGPAGITTNSVTGNVGVKTATPSTDFEVNGRGLFSEAVFTSSGANDGVFITHPAGEQGIGMFMSPSVGRADIRYDGNNLRLVTGNSYSPPSADNGITITNGGQVGIGTATPNLAARITASIIGAAPSGFIQGIDLRVTDNGTNVGLNSLTQNGTDNEGGVFYAWDGSNSNIGTDVWARGLGTGFATGGKFLAHSAATVTGTDVTAVGTSNPSSFSYGGKYNASNAENVVGVDVTSSGGSTKVVGGKFIAQSTPWAVGAEVTATGNGQPSSNSTGGSFFASNGQLNTGVSVRATGNDVTTHNYGVDVVASATGGFENYGVVSFANATNSVSRNYGVYANANNTTTGSSTVNYGVYATYFGGAPGTGSGGAGSYAGYFAGDAYSTGTFWPSDERLKTDINELTNALDKIKQLQPKTYYYKTEEFKQMNLRKGENMGFIAQQLEQVFPNMVKNTIQPAAKNSKGEATSDEVSFKAIDYVSLIPVLTAGIQEQQKQLEVQNALIAEQDKTIQDLEERVARLEQKTTGVTGDAGQEAATGPALYQNTPNPFSQATVIRYRLPESYTAASLMVFDMNGKQIKKIALQGNGQGDVSFSAADLSAGMYLYSLVLDGKEIDTKRMILTQ